MKQLWKSVTDDEIETLLLIVTCKSIETTLVTVTIVGLKHASRLCNIN